MHVCPICGAAHAACPGVTGAPRFVVDYPQEVIMPDQFTATERLYLDPDGKVVSADDPNRRSLLVSVGGTLPMERAQSLGLVDADGNAVATKSGSGAKAVNGPPANKAQASSATKASGA